MKKKTKAAPPPEKPGNPQILLRLPAEIGMPLMADAVKRGCTIQAIILEIVGAHYNAETPVPSRGRPKKVVE